MKKSSISIFIVSRVHCRPGPNVVDEQIKLQIENEWIDIKSKNKNDEIYDCREEEKMETNHILPLINARTHTTTTEREKENQRQAKQIIKWSDFNFLK